MRTEIVTTLKRQATKLLSELEKSKEPILITHLGVPSAYLVDAETYEAQQRRMSLLEGIARGEKAVDGPESVSARGAVGVSSQKWFKAARAQGMALQADC